MFGPSSISSSALNTAITTDHLRPLVAHSSLQIILFMLTPQIVFGTSTPISDGNSPVEFNEDIVTTERISNVPLGHHNFYSVSADKDGIRGKQHTRGRQWHASNQSNHGAEEVIGVPLNPVGLDNPHLLLGGAEEEYVEVPEGSGERRYSSDIFSEGINGTVVYAQEGIKEVRLPCVVKNKQDDENVSWIRMHDHHLITVGRQTYSSDQRFSVTYNRHLLQWSLVLRYPQKRDAGNYICQLSTHPPMALVTNLTITDAVSTILGGPEKHVQEGSEVQLVCEERLNYRPPEYVFWYHNGTMINFDINRQVQVKKKKNGSILTLKKVSKTDSGNFTCQPSNARNATIFLHIIHGDAPAAMQVSQADTVAENGALLLASLIISLLIFRKEIYASTKAHLLLFLRGCIRTDQRKPQRLRNHLLKIK